MATPTYTAIASITLGSSASSVEFSNIPQGYRDLIITSSLTGTGTVALSVNNNVSINYSRVFMAGTGSAAISVAQTFTNGMDLVSIADTQMSFRVDILDATAIDKFKPLLLRGDETGSAPLVVAHAGVIETTSSITSITLFVYSGEESAILDSGATFALYGIEA